MKAAAVSTWTCPFPGREKEATAFGREVDDFYGKKASDGLCTEPKWFWGPNGQDIWFVEGEFENLLAILAQPETQRMLVKARLLLQDYKWGFYQVGREEMFVPFEEELGKLKIK